MLIFGKSVQYLQIWGEDLSTAMSSLLWSGRHPSHGSHSPQTERTQAWSHVAQSPHRVDIRPHCCVEFRAGAAWTRRGVCSCHAPKTIIWLERSNKVKVFFYRKWGILFLKEEVWTTCTAGNRMHQNFLPSKRIPTMRNWKRKVTKKDLRNNKTLGPTISRELLCGATHHNANHLVTYSLSLLIWMLKIILL